MIERQLYWLLMVAGYLAVFIMGSIIIVWVLSLGGCSLNTLQPLPDKAIHTDQLRCIPDADFPHSCDGWLVYEKEKNNE